MHKRKYSDFFDRSEIEEFLANHIIGNTSAAEILGVGANDVSLLIRQGFLKPVSGPTIDGFGSNIFSRETVFQWKNDWINHKEAAQMLQINRGMLFDFARRGLIVILRPGWGAIPRGITWYSRQSILELQEEMYNKNHE